MSTSSGLGNNRRNTYPADYDRFADSLGPAMQYASKPGVTLAYHPHRSCIVETISETGQMVDRLPDLKLCIDTADPVASGGRISGGRGRISANGRVLSMAPSIGFPAVGGNG